MIGCTQYLIAKVEEEELETVQSLHITSSLRIYPIVTMLICMNGLII